ncbi:MAG TPA: hypothetical protein VMM37_01400 [Bacteroidota bacterium]|nr:hypothetical protein [Bacteroidota bacterium]
MKCAEGAVLLDIREEYVDQYKRFDVPVVLADTSGLHTWEAIALLRGTA